MSTDACLLPVRTFDQGVAEAVPHSMRVAAAVVLPSVCIVDLPAELMQ